MIGDVPHYLELAKHLSTTARVGNGYDHDRIGYNYRMTNLQAAVGCAQLEQLDNFVGAKRRIASRYRQAFAEFPALEFFPTPPWGDSSRWLSGVTIRAQEKTVPTVVELLNEQGIAARPFWKPMHLQAPYRDCPSSDMTVTESLWRGILTLPCSVGLTSQEQDHVIYSLLEICKGLLAVR